jgi:hypothetical protein
MTGLLAGITLGGIAGAVVFIAEVTTGASLGARDAFTIALSVGGMVWWMGRKFQSLEDLHRAADNRFESFERELECIKDRLDENEKS